MRLGFKVMLAWLCVGVLWACSRETSWKKSAGRELQQWCRADAGTRARTLGSVGNTPPWDRLFIIPPYSSPADAAKSHGFIWTEGDFGMESGDNAHLRAGQQGRAD
jgi:hypothetical protein